MKDKGQAAMDAEIIGDNKARVPSGEIDLKSVSYNQERIPPRLMSKWYSFVTLMLREGNGIALDEDERDAYNRYKAIFEPYQEYS